jgi:hypothetical protein
MELACSAPVLKDQIRPLLFSNQPTEGRTSWATTEIGMIFEPSSISSIPVMESQRNCLWSLRTLKRRTLGRAYKTKEAAN